MAGSLSSILIKFAVDNNSLSTQLQNSTREIRKWGDGLKSAGQSMSLYFTAPLVAAGVASTKMASDFDESMNKVDVAFGESSAKIQSFAKTTLDSFGIAEGTALDMAAGFGDMATSMDLPQDKAADMSKSLVGLAGDLASFKNKDIAQVTTALNGVFTGETESLKMLGIVMTEANLAQFALSQGVTKNIKDFSQAEKVQLRYAYVMAKTANAQGDFARTSDGAANQTRIHTESLKELGQSFGRVILPYYTKAVAGANSVVSSLKDMDEGTRGVVVGVGAVVAAAGPALIAIGSIANGFGQARIAAVAFKAVLLANPFTAIATALTAVVGGFVLAESRLTSLTDANRELNKVLQSGTDNIAKEKVELEKNLAVVKNELATKEQKEAAIKRLNELSPEYLGNLTLENAFTKEGTTLTNKYTDALLKKAQVMAAQEKLVAVQKELLDLQLGNLDAVKPSVWQTLGSALKSVGSSSLYGLEQSKALAKNYVEEGAELEKLRNKLIEFIGVNESAATSQDSLTESTIDLNIALENTAKAGTIDFYTAKITEIENLKNSTATTREEMERFEAQVKKLETARDNLEGKRPQVEALQFDPVGLQLSDKKQQVVDIEFKIGNLKEAQTAFLPIEQSFIDLQAQIDQLEMDKLFVEDPAKYFEDLRIRMGETSTAMTVFKQNAEIVGESVGNAFATLGANMVNSLGLAETGFQGFAKGIFSTVMQLIAMMLAQSISQSIAGATASGAATGPAAVVTTPAFIATAVSGVLAAFAAIPAFADGGVMPGNSMFGDKLFARINSGEMVLNHEQQRNLSNMLTPALTPADFATEVVAHVTLKGEDLDLAITRYNKNKTRKG